jgi:hypothetical protein
VTDDSIHGNRTKPVVTIEAEEAVRAQAEQVVEMEAASQAATAQEVLAIKEVPAEADINDEMRYTLTLEPNTTEDLGVFGQCISFSTGN